jgi:hypothetical protein
MRNVQLYIGEFNSNYEDGTNLSKDQLTKYLRLFQRSKIFGWAIWRWYYTHDSNIPAFNLTSIDNGKISPNVNFSNLVDAVGEIYQQTQKHLCTPVTDWQPRFVMVE